MTVGEWLEWAKADVLKRGFPELILPLEGVAQATERLRSADWNDDADKKVACHLAHPSTPLGVTLSWSKGEGEPRDRPESK